MTRVLILVVLALVALARADLPIHCLNRQIVGDWVFELSAASNDNSLRCGHGRPDRNMDHFSKEGFELDVVKRVKLTLSEPNVARDTESGTTGTWTMVYDEGFEVFIDDQVFFAFSKYEPKSAASLQHDDVEDYVSHCHETLVGWFHKLDGSHWGCYHGKRVGGEEGPTADEESSASTAVSDNNNNEPVLSPNALNFRQLYDPEVSFVEMVSHVHEDELWHPDMSFIELQNSAETSTWTAAVHREFLGNRVGHMMRMLGYRKKNIVKGSERHQGSRHRRRRKKRRHRRHVSAVKDDRPDHIKYAKLPDKFDWRNHEGVNYDGPVKNQGNCGSCFAVAAIYAAEARIRILSKGADRTLLSAQNVVSCSSYSQGCDGGYPYLVGKHAMDFGLIPEDCHPYTADDKTCEIVQSKSCPDPNNPVRYYASNYSYIGGYYGACSEVAMMEEIYKNGPIPVAFDAPSSLFYYSGGVFTGAAPPHEGPRLRDLHPWEKTNHAVTAVGWGVEKDGTKYWIIKNTWGANWGENGYFRIKRGTDECGIESMSTTLQMELPEKSD